jgi:hypothetical protein
MNGWIKIYRKMRQWQHYKTPSVRMVFEDLLLSATGIESTYNGVALVAGDAVSSVAILQRNTGLSKPTIVKAIRVLTESGEITRRFENNVAIYHINSFCFYQLQGGKKDLPLTEKGGKNILPQGVKQIDHSGKTILPHIRIKEDNKNNTVVVDAHTHTHEAFIADALNGLRVEQGCMAMGVTPDEYRQLVTEVTNDWIFRNIPDNEWTLTHLLAQMRIKHNIINRNNGNNQGHNLDPRAKLDIDAAKAMAALASEIGKPKEVPF